MTIGWKEYKCAELFEQVSTTKLKVKTKDCNPIGKYPVVDQGREKLAGFIDDEKRVISVSSPVCIFGDHTRVIKWIDFDFVPGADGTKILSPKSIINPRFFYYLLQNIPLIDKGYARHFKQLKEASVRVPEKTEQKRIADKLDSVLAKVEAAQARLDKIPAILKRFRQSVLAAATSGELTKELRANKEFGKVVCIGDLTSDIRYGTSKKCDYDNELTPVLRIPNISNGGVDPNDMKYAKFDDKEFEKLSLKTGDILVIRSNGSVDLVGKSALVSEEYEGYLYAGYLIRLRLPHSDYALPAYIDMALKSPQVRKVIELNARSTSGVNNINSKELASLSFPLPDVQEQKEIITKVSELFGKAEKMERKYLSGKASLDALTQSILTKAFSGKLP